MPACRLRGRRAGWGSWCATHHPVLRSLWLWERPTPHPCMGQDETLPCRIATLRLFPMCLALCLVGFSPCGLRDLEPVGLLGTPHSMSLFQGELVWLSQSCFGKQGSGEYALPGT